MRISDWSSDVCSSDLERLRLTGGLRYSYEKKDFAYRVLLNGNQVDAGQPKSSWTARTPKIGIDYDVAADVMVYASATRGFKSGGFQLGDGRSEEHTSELQSLMRISYAVFCLKKQNTKTLQRNHN